MHISSRAQRRDLNNLFLYVLCQVKSEREEILKTFLWVSTGQIEQVKGKEKDLKKLKKYKRLTG